MRLVVLAVIAGLAWCYEAPTRDASCTILCATSCPDDMTCVNGYCVAAGETCEPVLSTVHAGNGFACALDEVGRRWCWGANDHQQINPSGDTQIVHATLTGDKRWDVLASGGDHACGVRSGELYCWGGNDRQQVTGTVIGDVATPVRIAAPNGVPWSFVATGFNATCAIANQLYCWGAGDNGQLGTGSTGDTGAPSPVASAITDWDTVSLGRGHACAISRTGGLHCWGRNSNGQVGNGTAPSGTAITTPQPIALPDATSVAVAATSTCAVAAGQLWCWGNPSSTRLGDPALTDTCASSRIVPALSSGLDGWSKVSASQTMSCGLRGDEVWCWGFANGGGGLGKGVWNGNGWGRVTIGASDISLGWNANVDEEGDTADVDLACIIVSGKVRCWGDNRFGQLAQGDSTMHPTPREIAGNHRWSTILASDNHTCGITDTKELYCWGTMLDAQTIGQIAGTNNVPCGAIPGLPCTLGEPTRVPFQPLADEIAIGDAHTCARLGTTVTCWGTNNDGQLGVVGAPSPVTVPGTWTKLYSSGSSGTCAVQNGQTWCWGAVTDPGRPLAHDPRLDGMSSIFVNATVGDTTRRGSTRAAACILDPNNQLLCFGDNTQGQYGTGPLPAAVCGNLACELTETNTTCPTDCPGTSTCAVNSCGVSVCSASYATCGDGTCTVGYGETCSSCGQDCGQCPFQPLGRTYTMLSIGMSSSQAALCGVRPDGAVECWARNARGQAGALDTTTGAPLDPVYTPNTIAGLGGCTAVATGEATSCAICNGDIHCWGSNRRGTLGAGNPTATPVTTPRKIAVELAAGDRFVELSAGTGYTCARSEQGRGFCWGFQRYGALGTGSTSANAPVAIKLAPAQ